MVLPEWSIHGQLGLQTGGDSSSPKEVFCVPIITGLREDADTNNRRAGQNCGTVMPL